MVLGLLMMSFIFLIQLSMGWITITDYFHTHSDAQEFLPAILVFAMLFIFVGIYEELLSRGYHITNMAEGFKTNPVNHKRLLLLL